MRTTHHASTVDPLLAYPSAIERIAADYPHYTIHRERQGAHHGAWVAVHEDVQVRANSPADLLERLHSQELIRLRTKFGPQCRVWRDEHTWLAVLRSPDGTERTITRPTPIDLEEGVLHPPRIGQRTSWS